MRTDLKIFLLQDVDLFRFPPPGRYIKGLPTVLFEAIIANIDAHNIAHALVAGGKINPRSLGTNDNETYHSVEESLCKCWGGIPSDRELQHIKYKAALMSCLLLKDKLFPFHHSRKLKYPQIHPEDYILEPTDSTFSPPTFIFSISVSDHTFDLHSAKN